MGNQTGERALNGLNFSFMELPIGIGNQDAGGQRALLQFKLRLFQDAGITQAHLRVAQYLH